MPALVKKPPPGPVHKIAKQLIHLAVPIGPLVLDPQNAKKHPPKSIDAISKSLDRYGQQKPIVVRAGTNIVLAGNGTLESARVLGWTHIAASVVEMDDLTAAGYAIADNRTAELSEWDHERLSKTIGSLKAAGDGHVDSLGYTPDHLDVLLAADWTPAQVSDEQFGTDDEKGNHAFWVSADQKPVVEEAIERYREQDSENRKELDDGACLEGICLQFLESAGGVALLEELAQVDPDDLPESP